MFICWQGILGLQNCILYQLQVEVQLVNYLLK